MLRLLLGLLLSLTLALPGCGKKAAEKPAVGATASTPRAAVKLAILVVDDPELAAGIGLLRGEWAERSGGELLVEQWTVQELLDAKDLPTDVVIYPSRYLGTLVDREWLRPMRKSLLRDKELNLQEVFSLVKDRVMRLGGEIFALSLGEPPLMLAWEGDVPPELEEDHALTWSQYDRLRGGRANSSLAVELIVRAVSYSGRRGDSAVLFDSQTMEPRLLEPPFVRALHDLVLLGKKESAGEVRLSWPTATPEHREGEATVSFFAIPRADEVYDRSLETWGADEEMGESPTFLGFSGRLASVSHASRNAVSAFKLLKWLASGDTAVQVSQRSNATIWFRRSQTSQSDKWLGQRNVSDGTSLAVTKLLAGKRAYVLPRIPGIDKYLESLDKAVAGVLSGDLEEEKALREATARWQAIKESYGKQRQQQAYRRHLGFDDLAE